MTNEAQTQIEPQSSGKSWLNLPQNVWVLTATSFLTDISTDMVTNLIPLFLTGVLGQATAVVGVIDGVAETTASIMKIFSGALSDKLGKRKGLAILGYGLSTLSKPFLYFANSWGMVMGVRFSDRLGKGIRTAPKEALLSQSVKKEQRGLAFGIHRAGDTAGAFTGILLATLIIAMTQTDPTRLSARTFQIAALASLLPALLAVIVLAAGARDVNPAEGKPGGKPSLSLKGMDRRFLAYLGITVLFTLGNSSDSFIILRAQERGLTILQVMAMLLTFNAIYTILAGPAGALSDKIGRKYLILGGWFAYSLIYLGFALAKTGAAIWALFGLYGVYYALTEGAAKAFIADLVPDEKRGTAYGLYAAAIGLTAFPASAIAGVIWQGLGSWSGLGPSAPFYFGGIMALIATVLLFFWMPKNTHRSKSMSEQQ